MRDGQQEDDPGERMNRRKVNGLRNDLRIKKMHWALEMDLRPGKYPGAQPIAEAESSDSAVLFPAPVNQSNMYEYPSNYHLITAATLATMSYMVLKL